MTRAAIGRGTRGAWASAVAAAVALGVLAVLGVLNGLAPSGGGGSAAGDGRVRAVADTLTCPDCRGVTVADSPDPVAAAMRAEATAQLSSGRSPDEVRAWFVARYGEQVDLTSGPLGGPVARLVLAVLPAVTLGAAAGAVVLRRRRRAPTGPQEPARLPTAEARPPGPRGGREGARWVVTAVATLAVASGLVLAEAQRQTAPVVADAATTEQPPHELRPAEPGPTRAAWSLVRAGRTEEARARIRPVVRRHPRDPAALLVLAAAVQATDPARATRLAERARDLLAEHLDGGDR